MPQLFASPYVEHICVKLLHFAVTICEVLKCPYQGNPPLSLRLQNNSSLLFPPLPLSAPLFPCQTLSKCFIRTNLLNTNITLKFIDSFYFIFLFMLRKVWKEYYILRSSIIWERRAFHLRNTATQSRSHCIVLRVKNLLGSG